MKESELRIGNYVHFKSEDNDFSIELKFEFESGWNMDYIKPIPLTEEWLVKFGFLINGSCCENNKIVLYKIINPTEFHLAGVKLQYVHQLQNLYFALTGEELTLKTEL